MPVTSMPVFCSERMAVSRPEPGPFTWTSTLRTPCSIAPRAAFSAAIWAAYGVDLREPLKPTLPADAHDSTFPSRSVIVMIVLLNELLMWQTPWETLRRSRLRGRRPPGFGFAIRWTSEAELRRPAQRRLRHCVPCRSLAHLLLAGDGLLGALAGAGVGLGALAAHGKAAAVAEALPAADLHLPADVLLDLTPQVALDLEVLVDVGADLVHLFVGEVADPEDVGERDLQPLLAGDVDAGDTCHVRCCLPISRSALALLVPGVGADDLDAPVAADHLALLTHLLDAGADLHRWRSLTCTG